MTRSEYVDFEKRFADFMDREGLSNLSTVITEEEDTEPYFSHRPCDCCQRLLAGNRYDCAGYNQETKEVQDGYSVCEDCVYYAEYGVLDDTTMMEVEQSDRN